MTYRRRLKYYLITLCRLHDSPRAVSGGFAFGALTHFFPTFGLGPFIAAGAAGLFRTNMIASILGWAIIMPLFPAFFYLNIITGRLIISLAPGRDLPLREPSYLVLKKLLFLGKAFFIGSIINSVLGLVLFWWVGYILLKKYRNNILRYVRGLYSSGSAPVV